MIHCSIIFSRACLAIFETDMYHISFKASKSYQNLNQEFIRASEPFLKSILIALIPIGAIIDIAIFWRPHLARLICYFEIVFLAALMFCPLDFGAMSLIACTVFISSEYLMFSSFDVVSNIMFTCILLLRLLVSGTLTY